VVATRTTNPLLLGGLVLIIVYTVLHRRSTAPWALAFRLYVYLAIFIVLMRMGLRIVFSAAGPTVLFNLPTWTLPGPLSAIRLFGPVSAEALIVAATAGAQLGVMILAIGAANALANPKRLLAAVPGALYEWGTVVVIALSVFPQLAESLVRVRRARQLRAETGKGVHLIRYIAMPVLSDALDRSLLLAGAMDSRGYGRSLAVSGTARGWTSVLLLGSTIALSIGAYGLLAPSSTPLWMGLPMVVGGLVGGLAGLRLSGRRVQRSRYRPDPMALPEWLVLGSAIAATIAIVLAGAAPLVMYPLAMTWPPLSLPTLIALATLMLPSLVTPPPEPVKHGLEHGHGVEPGDGSASREHNKFTCCAEAKETVDERSEEHGSGVPPSHAAFHSVQDPDTPIDKERHQDRPHVSPNRKAFRFANPPDTPIDKQEHQNGDASREQSKFTCYAEAKETVDERSEEHRPHVPASQGGDGR
jgi:energy-coupling factor transport system permease protein